MAALNTEFHLAIIELARNKMLLDMTEPVRGHLRRLFRIARRFDSSALGAEHEAIYSAIAQGDTELAGSMVRIHIEATRAPTIGLLEADQAGTAAAADDARVAAGDVDPIPLRAPARSAPPRLRT